MHEPTRWTVQVRFAGPGAGTGPLTWGQKAILQDMRETGWSHNACGVYEVDPGTSLDTLTAQLRELMCRYPALRMRLATGPDGRPHQEVAASGQIDVDVLELPDELEPAAVAKHAEDLWFTRLVTPLDLYRDWPVQLTVIQHQGQPRHRILTFSHLVIDGVSFALLLPDVGLADPADGSAVDPNTIGTLELGYRENTPELRRVSDRAMRYWQSQLREIAPLTFGPARYPQGRQGKRFWHGRFHSSAAYLAILAIARRTRTDTSRVLLAVIATAIGRATGVCPLTTKVIVTNRYRPGYAQAMVSLSQNSVLTLDVSGATLDQAVARARQVSLAAGMFAYYDPDSLADLIERLDRERGYPARVTCRINDRRMLTRPGTEAAAGTAEITPQAIRAAQAETFLSWDGSLDHLPEQAFITIEDHPGAVRLQVIFDLAALTEEQVEALLRGVEEVAVAAAFDPDAPTLVEPGVPAR